MHTHVDNVYINDNTSTDAFLVDNPFQTLISREWSQPGYKWSVQPGYRPVQTRRNWDTSRYSFSFSRMCCQPESDFDRFCIKRMRRISCTLFPLTSFMYSVADFCSVTVIRNNNYGQTIENSRINHHILLVQTFRRNLLPPPSGYFEKVNC